MEFGLERVLRNRYVYVTDATEGSEVAVITPFILVEFLASSHYARKPEIIRA